MRSAVFLPIPGIAWKRAWSPSAIALRSSAAGEPETTASATFGPMPAHGEEVDEELALLGVGEPVELERVLAHVEVRLDRHLGAGRRPAQHGRRRRDEVADAVHVEHEAVRRAPGRPSSEPRDHAGLLTTPAARAAASSAWQMATASASAAWDVARLGVEREEHPHHPRDLPLVGPAVAADRLLDARRRVLGARDPGRRGRDERGAARLPDEERDAGVGTDERLLQRDGVRLVLRDEAGDPVEDRPAAGARAAPWRRTSSTRGRGP